MEINPHRRNAYSRYRDGQLRHPAIIIPDPSSQYDQIHDLMLSSTYEILSELFSSSIQLTQEQLQQNQRWAIVYLRDDNHCELKVKNQYRRIFNANYFFEQSCIQGSGLFMFNPDQIYKYMCDNGYE